MKEEFKLKDESYVYRPSLARRIALAGILAGTAAALSGFWFPLGPAKCYPFQHAVNVLAGVALGPWWSGACAVVTSAVRLALGTGTFFAFPGSVPGAILAGLGARAFRQRPLMAVPFECLGTCVIGAYLASALVGPAVGKAVSFNFLAVAFASSSIPGAALGGLIAHLAIRGGVMHPYASLRFIPRQRRWHEKSMDIK